MNILLLFDHYHPYVGGAEIVNRAVAEYLARRHTVTVLSNGFAGSGPARQTVNNVALYRPLCSPRLLHSLTAFCAGVGLARRADAILCATYASGLAGRLLAGACKKPAVLLVHEVLDEHWAMFSSIPRLHRLYEKLIVTRPFDRYIAVSDFTRRKLLGCGIPSERITVIYNGLDNDLFAPRPVNRELRRRLAGDADFVYLFYGRPGGSKGLPFLLQALPRVAQAVPRSHAVLLLSPEPAREYAGALEMIKSLGLEPHVTVHPPVPRRELPDYINCADAVVVPSLSEGFGFTAVESCALGKTLVATHTGSLPEVVSGRVVFVKKADSADLARGIIDAFRGRWELVPDKRFSWLDSLPRYEAVLEQAAAENRR
jgi:glycosyltransferase involved in cell wall biosynthesis